MPKLIPTEKFLGDIEEFKFQKETLKKIAEALTFLEAKLVLLNTTSSRVLHRVLKGVGTADGCHACAPAAIRRTTAGPLLVSLLRGLAHEWEIIPPGPAFVTVTCLRLLLLLPDI